VKRNYHTIDKQGKVGERKLAGHEENLAKQCFGALLDRAISSAV